MDGSEVGNAEIEGDLSLFEYAINLNTRSVLRLCQLAFPHLIKTKGEVVNVSSIAGLRNGMSQLFPFYSVSKAAQDQLTRNLAVHYIRKGVRVNSVNPGLISTSIVQRSEGLTNEIVRTDSVGHAVCMAHEKCATKDDVTALVALEYVTPLAIGQYPSDNRETLGGSHGEERVAAMPSCIPCGRVGTPDDVAEAILFLADRKRSGFIVGHQLVIDGGSSLQMPVICDGFNVFAEVAAEMGSKAQEH
ncbi:unnamed protein product [Heligmosomoides polygyrus]|uniref:Zgc:101858 n=1 Tax=Heligmosomoides polygyrus TaxID=6339 RepID=A0A3P8BDV2_HELPZ|nr:unnamed protein product [Heligmosomoides polygyrus]